VNKINKIDEMKHLGPGSQISNLQTGILNSETTDRRKLCFISARDVSLFPFRFHITMQRRQFQQHHEQQLMNHFSWCPFKLSSLLYLSRFLMGPQSTTTISPESRSKKKIRAALCAFIRILHNRQYSILDDVESGRDNTVNSTCTVLSN
jgi:hypothetical protein